VRPGLVRRATGRAKTLIDAAPKFCSIPNYLGSESGERPKVPSELEIKALARMIALHMGLDPDVDGMPDGCCEGFYRPTFSA
jgi:hypothetical protein